MTLDDAKKVGTIVGTADTGCSVCVDSLILQLNAAFPQFIWTRAALIHGDEDTATHYAVEVIER